MVVMINGSFGVGKTTVAKLLRRALAGSVIYDPERVGLILQRLPDGPARAVRSPTTSSTSGCGAGPPPRA